MQFLIRNSLGVVAVLRRYVSSDRTGRHTNRSNFRSLDESRA